MKILFIKNENLNLTGYIINKNSIAIIHYSYNKNKFLTFYGNDDLTKCLNYIITNKIIDFNIDKITIDNINYFEIDITNIENKTNTFKIYNELRYLSYKIPSLIFFSNNLSMVYKIKNVNYIDIIYPKINKIDFNKIA